jgi:hypothetical protein
MTGCSTSGEKEEENKLALATGWITPEMSEAERQERLADTAFISYLKMIVERDIATKIVFAEPVGYLNPESEEWGLADERHTAELFIQNNTSKEIPDSAYTISYLTIEGLRDCLSDRYEYYPSQIKTIPGLLLTPGGNATFTIEDFNDIGGTSFQGLSYLAKVNWDMDNPIMFDIYEPTGKEYKEYLEYKNGKNTDNTSYVFEGFWNSEKYGSQPCRITFTKEGQTIHDAEYTNLKFNSTQALKCEFRDGILAFVGQKRNQQLFIHILYDGHHMVGIGQDFRHDDYNVEIELYRKP